MRYRINAKYFYPRSPCGERRAPPYNLMIQHTFLSTLSLRRATIDSVIDIINNIIFLSTLSLRRATPATTGNNKHSMISIHALLAESDPMQANILKLYRYFYPRSPCGERPMRIDTGNNIGGFLSTLSLRRATHYDNYNLHCVEISIHALLAESDPRLDVEY